MLLVSQVDGPAAPGTVQRRQLHASSGQGSLLDGYEVQKQATYMVPFQDSRRLRFVGTKWSNRAAGGLLLTQVCVTFQACRCLNAASLVCSNANSVYCAKALACHCLQNCNLQA